MTERLELAGPVVVDRSPRGGIARLTLVGGAMVAAWVVLGVLAPVIAPYDPTATDLRAILRPPGSPGHLLGTDNLGRDILSRLLHATLVDLSMGLIGVAIPLAIGVLIGLVAGYVGGIVDTVLMRVLDVALAFPFFVLVLAIIAVLGPGLINYYIALAVVAWVPYARLIRSEVLVLRRSEFVEAARVLGYSPARVMFRHVLPNALSAAIVFAMTDVILVILLGSGLSFYGLGAQPPTPEWGRMIAEGRSVIGTAWWISALPGLAIVLVTLSFSLLGDGLAKQLRVRA